MTVCPGYWAWILQQHQALEIASIVPVRDELARGNDDLTQCVLTVGCALHEYI
ncbi:DUF4411 family protein [Pseudomonas extremorientalis]|uniref:DUF4411 family protein n=1 Tax=Pseudomonas extremorientalis TaxID=169669 RepID=UPI0039E11927